MKKITVTAMVLGCVVVAGCSGGRTPSDGGIVPDDARVCAPSDMTYLQEEVDHLCDVYHHCVLVEHRPLTECKDDFATEVHLHQELYPECDFPARPGHLGQPVDNASIQCNP